MECKEASFGRAKKINRFSFVHVKPTLEWLEASTLPNHPVDLARVHHS